MNLTASFGISNNPDDQILWIVNSGEFDGACASGGPLGSIYNDLVIQPWISSGYNCTLRTYRTEDSVGSISGLRESVIRGEVDMSLISTRIYDTDQVHYSLPLCASYLSILSMYNHTNGSTKIDLLDTYLSFHWSYYFSIVFIIFFFTVVLHHSFEFVQKFIGTLHNIDAAPVWIISRAMLKQHRFPNVNISLNILSLSVTLFFFFLVNCFLLGMISTDLVVIDEPIIFRDYQSIIKNDQVKVIFDHNSIEAEYFRKAEDGSDEAEIWNKRSIPISKNFIDVVIPLFYQNSITIIREWLAYLIGSIILPYLSTKGIDSARIFLVRDPTGKSLESAYMISKDAHPMIKKYAYETAMKLTESGIFVHKVTARKETYNADISIDRFISSKLDLHEKPAPFISMGRIHKLVYLYLFFISASAIVLVMEKCLSRFKERALKVLQLS